MNQTANNLKQTVKGLILLAVVVASSSSLALDCATKGLRSAAGAILVASQGKSTLKASEDRRVLISEMRVGNGISPQAVEFAKRAVATTFEISESTLNGKKLNNFSGSGFLIKNPFCNGRYGISVRHNVNATEKVKTANGNIVEQPTQDDPTGARVKLRHGLDGSGKVQGNNGTVISKGGLIGTNSDWILVRLDQPTNAIPLDITKGTAEEIAGRQMMSLGLPEDMSGQGDASEVAVDPSCKGKGLSKDGGLTSTCIGAPGNSGGPAAINVAEAGQPENWKLIGMAVTIDGQNSNTSKSSVGATKGELEFLILGEISSILSTQIRADVAQHPCK